MGAFLGYCLGADIFLGNDGLILAEDFNFDSSIGLICSLIGDFNFSYSTSLGALILSYFLTGVLLLSFFIRTVSYLLKS